MSTHSSRRVFRGGFSIVETAIVLGVMAIILGGLWAYASNGFQNAKTQQLKEEITTVVNNVRGFYSAQTGIGSSAGDAISIVTPLLIQENVIPATMVRNGSPCTNGTSLLCADSPWGSNGNVTGGTFGVCAWPYVAFGAPAGTHCPPTTITGGQQYFAIEVSGLSQVSCINIVPGVSATSGPPGLEDVLINGASARLAGSPLPVSVAFANDKCTTPALNTIDFVYRLRTSNF